MTLTVTYTIYEATRQHTWLGWRADVTWAQALIVECEQWFPENCQITKYQWCQEYAVSSDSNSLEILDLIDILSFYVAVKIF